MRYLSRNVKKTVGCTNVEPRGKIWVVIVVWMLSAFEVL